MRRRPPRSPLSPYTALFRALAAKGCCVFRRVYVYWFPVPYVEVCAVAIVKIVLQIVVILASILLTMLILLHKGKGGGLSDMFGGGIGSNAGTSGAAEKNLNRLTIIVALIWVAIIIALDLITKYKLA